MSLISDLDQHQIYISRVATELLRNNVFPSHEAAYKAIRLILLDAENVGSLSKLNAVNRAIAKAVEESTAPAWAKVTSELTNLAVYESGYYAELIGGYAGVRMKTPPKTQVRDWMSKALMSLESGRRVKAGTWPEFVAGNQGSFTDTVQNIVKRGYLNGSTVSEMIKELRPAVDGILKRDAEALVRTGTQFYATQGREQMTLANEDLIEREVPVVTFDNRLSEKCRAVDSKYSKGWPVGKSPIGYPPYHINCRTNVIPLVAGQEYPDGLRPAVGAKDTKAAEEKFEARESRTGKKPKYRGRKDLDVFEIDRLKTSTRYDTWLRQQPDFFIKDVLGETRFRLFKDGGMSLSSFSDLTLRQLTINELRQRDAAAFVRAGLGR